MKHFFRSLILETIEVEDNVKSAIIGYWRCGATIDEIMSITNIRYMVIQQIINDYQATVKAFTKNPT